MTPANVAGLLAGIRQAAKMARAGALHPGVPEVFLWIAAGVDHRSDLAKVTGLNVREIRRICHTLQGRGYVEQRGRDDGPGQAVLWGTTPLFLEKLGINSVDELPPLAEFVPDAEIVEALEATLRITPIEVDGGGVDSAPNSDE